MTGSAARDLDLPDLPDQLPDLERERNMIALSLVLGGMSEKWQEDR